jgi:hypothetical protein
MISQRALVIAIHAILVLVPRPGRAVPPGAPDSVQQEKGSLEQRVQILDQQVRVLKRLRELDREAAALRQSDTTAFGRVTISGVVYGDYFYNVRRDTAIGNGVSVKNIGTGGAQNFNGFQFRRVYLTFDDDVTTSVSLRFRFEDDQIAAASGGSNLLFIKDASVKVKGVFPGSDLIFGEQVTPLEISEAAWGYRSLEKTQMDLRGILATRDLALALRGRLDAEGSYSYWVMVGNNSNTAVESDKFKRYYASFLAKPFAGFQLWLYGDYAAQAAAANIGNRDKTTLAALASYGAKESFNIGVEAFSQSAAHTFQPLNGAVTGAYESLVGRGVSAFGWYNVVPRLAVVARYDIYDPNTSSAANAGGDVRRLLIAGLSWNADRNFFVQPNIEIESYQEKPASGIVPGVSYASSTTARVTLVLQY